MAVLPNIYGVSEGGLIVRKCILILLGSLFYSCCADVSDECPAGPRYSDFFTSERPQEMLFADSEGTEIKLLLTNEQEVDAYTLTYNGCASPAPLCVIDGWYSYSSTISPVPIELDIKFPTYGNMNLFFKTDSLPVYTSIGYNPLQLATSSGAGGKTYHTIIELGGEEYHDVIQIHYSSSYLRLVDLYFSSYIGLIQLVLEIDQEPVAFTRQM